MDTAGAPLSGVGPGQSEPRRESCRGVRGTLVGVIASSSGGGVDCSQGFAGSSGGSDDGRRNSSKHMRWHTRYPLQIQTAKPVRVGGPHACLLQAYAVARRHFCFQTPAGATPEPADGRLGRVGVWHARRHTMTMAAKDAPCRNEVVAMVISNCAISYATMTLRMAAAATAAPNGPAQGWNLFWN